MPIALEIQTDRREFPNGIKLPFDSNGGDIFSQTHELLALTPVEITLPAVTLSDKEIGRVFFNGKSLVDLGLYFVGPKSFPTPGNPTNGFIVDPGIIVINKNEHPSFFLQSKIDQTITILFYSGV